MTSTDSDCAPSEWRLLKSDWFHNLSTPEVAAIVRDRGPRTVVFAAGGTTRWFILNHLQGWPSDMSYWPEYLTHAGEQFLRIARLFFDHGVQTLFTHAIVPGQLEGGKGDSYLPLALTSGMETLAGNAEFLRFYDEYRVRVCFFGNYRQVLQHSEHARTLGHFDRVAAQTRANDGHRLFWGFNTDSDQVTPIIELAVQYYREHGRVPARDDLIRLYYGYGDDEEPVPPVDVFISFNRTRTAGLMPPLLEGRADLYFTVGLSYDFSGRQLRSILYDHLFARRGRHRDYSQLPPEAFSQLQEFYQWNRDRVIGLGQRYESGAVYHPTPQVRMPEGSRLADGGREGGRPDGKGEHKS